MSESHGINILMMFFTIPIIYSHIPNQLYARHYLGLHRRYRYEAIFFKTTTNKRKQLQTCQKEMATHSSFLAWRIPWTQEPGGLQSTGSQRVGHDWATSLHFTSLHFTSLQKHKLECDGTFLFWDPFVLEPTYSNVFLWPPRIYLIAQNYQKPFYVTSFQIFFT